MNGIDLLDCMDLVDDRFVEEAAYHVKSKTINIYYYISLAASLILTVGSGGWMLLGSDNVGSYHRAKSGAATAMSNSGNFSVVLFAISMFILIAVIVAIIVRNIRCRSDELE